MEHAGQLEPFAGSEDQDSIERTAGSRPGSDDGLRDERRSEGAVGIHMEMMGQEGLGNLTGDGPIKRPETPGTFRETLLQAHRYHPLLLQMDTEHQRGCKLQQQDQSHQTTRIRLPGRRLLLPQDPCGFSRKSVKNPKQELEPVLFHSHPRERIRVL